MSNDSTKKTLLVTIVLSLVCSIFVAGSAVYLKPEQEKNKALDIQRNIITIAGLTKNANALSNEQVSDLVAEVIPKLVNLKTGKFVDASPAEIKAYDQRIAAKNPKQSHALSTAVDIASIKRQAYVAKVYEIKKNGKLKTLILPVHGYGLWSTLYGFIALAGDLNTVVGFGFYEQAETPGLGGEVDNPIWKVKWIGKKVYTGDGSVGLSVIKGSVNPASSLAKYQVDGLAGATLTSNGVTNLVHFWMGKDGFEPFIKHLKAGDA
ncbi:MAG: Na(+)-translocating NADH-quinone reductase subunit C [Endozoicomonas sp. (ex Botrylloides leachii)]|nr:Na(+)-translocating NADH-quinone reductase subunit C [Endozoicomonas sp. (ex Botrylloides leachii)]